MTDLKKRLKEILEETIDYDEESFGEDGHSTYIIGIKEAITKILKEFVHKDNLPNEELLEYDICSLVESELISMSRAREILCIEYLEDMREKYENYIIKKQGKK